jgi:hypothetical protein
MVEIETDRTRLSQRENIIWAWLSSISNWDQCISRRRFDTNVLITTSHHFSILTAFWNILVLYEGSLLTNKSQITVVIIITIFHILHRVARNQILPDLNAWWHDSSCVEPTTSRDLRWRWYSWMPFVQCTAGYVGCCSPSRFLKPRCNLSQVDLNYLYYICRWMCIYGTRPIHWPYFCC